MSNTPTILEQKPVVQLVELSENVLFTFVHVPNGYKVSSLKTDNGVKSEMLGYLNQFNRIKKLQPLRAKVPDSNLMQFFTNCLKARNWDFKLHPNPYGYISYIP